MQILRGIDPGFGYAPGRSVSGDPPPRLPNTPPSLAGQIERTTLFALDKATQLPDDIADEYIRELRKLPRVSAVIEALRAAGQLSEAALRLLERSS